MSSPKFIPHPSSLPMKASEVLRRYAAEERDFRCARLRGQSFRGQNLSGADFSEADIRGTDFSNAILKKASFVGANAGLPTNWKLGFAILFCLGLIISFVVAFSFIHGGWFLWRSNLELNWLAIAIFALVSAVIAYQGLEAGFVVIAIVMAISLLLMGLSALTGGEIIPFTIVIVLPVVLSLGGSDLVAGSIVVATIELGAAIGLLVAPLYGATMLAGALAGKQFGSTPDVVEVPLDVIVPLFAAWAIAQTLLGGYMGWHTLKGNDKFALIWKTSLVLSTIGGTSFRGADLTAANFTRATLKNTNFTNTWEKDAHGKKHRERKTILDWVCWQDAKQLDRARVGNSILTNPAVRDLLITRNGYQKSYIDANLRAANLDGVNLEQANLTWADLTCATLHYVNLKNANLTESLVLNADFRGATLTGACLEAWNIDSHANLEQVDCQHVYLLRNEQERRPSSGNFAPGEFTKLFQEVLNTVDLIFRNGIDWKAFVVAFKQVQVENEETPLEIQSIENKGDGVVVVRVSVPHNANKPKIHSEFNQQYELALKAIEARYQAELQAKDSDITYYRQQNTDMLGAIRSLANRPISIINENKLMSNSSDQSRNLNVGGNLNATGSSFNLGEISGNLTNTLNQLSAHPQAAELADLLKQLQRAIESDPDLTPPDKTEALEQIGTLAKAGENPQDSTLKKLAATSVKILKGTVAALPSTATIVEACSKLLPLISKALGLG
ncbi:pentapeptide repeat-containing protein [Phormidesmis sp. 146-12]